MFAFFFGVFVGVFLGMLVMAVLAVARDRGDYDF
jgi:hypothetical protein